MESYRVFRWAVAFTAAIAGMQFADAGLSLVVLLIAGAGATASIARPRARSIAFASFIGMLWAYVHMNTPGRSDAHMQTFSVTIVDATRAEEGLTLTVRRDDGSLALFSGADTSPVAIGERLTVRARCEVFDEPRNAGEPSERAIEAERGIACRFVHARILARTAPDPYDVTLWLPRARAALSARLHALVPEPSATLLAGALWGERNALPPDLRAEFQETGTVHVLVTAGLHLGVIAAIVVGTLRALRVGRLTAAILAITAVWLYAALSGGHLPSERAAMMLTFGLLAHAIGRQALSWNAFGAALVAIDLIRPASVTTAGFALSFSCVAAIIAFATPLSILFARTGAPEFVARGLGVACATQLGTWPLTAALFLVLAPYAPVANLLVVPVVGIVMLVGMFALATSPLVGTPLAALPLAASAIATILCEWIAAVVRFCASLPHAHLVATPPPTWSIVLYAVALVVCARLITIRHTRLAVFCVLSASACCLWPPRPTQHDLAIDLIDVGQADAILIRTTGGTYLVDAGGRLERGPSTSGSSTAAAVGERIVVPFLVRAGIHHIDAILLSHPHGDHAGGVAPVVHSLGATILADSGQRYPGRAYHAALDAALDAHTTIVEPRAGDVWTSRDGLTFRFYGPMLPFVRGGPNDINDNSLVFRLEYRNFRMLFTGDAGARTEARLLDAGYDLHADVLKVGHHGSAYSSTPDFLRAVGARIALISVGRHNLFGHPAPTTLAALRDAGMTIHRTDEDGEISLRTDGTSTNVTTMLAH